MSFFAYLYSNFIRTAKFVNPIHTLSYTVLCLNETTCCSRFITLKERYDECMEYKRSMILYDRDSLIGVNQSEPESSMGSSTSSSVVNQSIYIYVTSRFREAKVEWNRSDAR